MSAEQTRARRLAERLESPPCHRTLTDDDCAEAAAELRRLSDSEAALLAALKSAHVRCTSKEFDRWRALIEATEEARK